MQAAEELPSEPEKPRRKRSNGPLARFWRRVRKPLVESRVVKNVIASTLAFGMRFVRWTNPLAKGSVVLEDVFRANPRTIYALWHGQHIMAPAFNPRWHPLVAMFSRSADAEINALVAEKLGLETARGSGGREREKSQEKGGARALIALKRALDKGKSVSMIADITHGEARQAGLGIVTLARISGRPVIGIAIATSRRKVLEKSWDRTAINLPFGRCGVAVTEPIYVSSDAGDADMQRLRVEMTDALNAATDEAYRLADSRP